MKLFRLFTIFALILCSVACATTDLPESDLEKQNLKGKVKSVSAENFELLPHENIAGHLSIGNKTYENGFDSFIEFNTNGFMTQKRLFNTDGSTSTIYTYEYNKNNLLTKMTKYTATENVDRVFVYTYNKNNLKESSVTYTALGNVADTEKYFYTDNLLTTHKIYAANGDFMYEWLYEYDNRGNRVLSQWLVNNDTVKISYAYNEINLLTEQTEINQGAVTKWQYSHDKQGNVTNEVCTYHSGKRIVTSFEYEYDEFNNWVIKLTFKDGVPKYITERTIEYE